MVVSNQRTWWVTGLSDWGPQAKTFLDLENGPGSYAAYPIAPPTVAFEQKAHSVAFPICRIKPVAWSGQGIQFKVLPDLGPQWTVQILSPILLHCQLMLALTSVENSAQSLPSNKPEQKMQAIIKCILQSYLGRTPKPTVLCSCSQPAVTPSPETDWRAWAMDSPK